MHLLYAFLREIRGFYRVTRVSKDAIIHACRSILRLFKVLRLAFRARQVNVTARVRHAAQHVPIFNASGETSDFCEGIMNVRFVKITVCVSLALKNAQGKRHARAKRAHRKVHRIIVRCFMGDQLTLLYLRKRRRSEGRIHARLRSSKDFSLVKRRKTRRIRFVARIIHRRICIVSVLGLRHGRKGVLQQAKDSVLRITSQVRRIFRQANRIVLSIQNANALVNHRRRGNINLSIQVGICQRFQRERRAGCDRYRRTRQNRGQFLGHSFMWARGVGSLVYRYTGVLVNYTV